MAANTDKERARKQRYEDKRSKRFTSYLLRVPNGSTKLELSTLLTAFIKRIKEKEAAK